MWIHFIVFIQYKKNVMSNIMSSSHQEFGWSFYVDTFYCLHSIQKKITRNIMSSSHHELGGSFYVDTFYCFHSIQKKIIRNIMSSFHQELGACFHVDTSLFCLMCVAIIILSFLWHDYCYCDFYDTLLLCNNKEEKGGENIVCYIVIFLTHYYC